MRARAYACLLGIAVGLGLGAAGCFSPQQPPCAFSCAGDQLCPQGYVCAADGFCHRSDGRGECTLVPPDGAADGAAPGDGEAQ